MATKLDDHGYECIPGWQFCRTCYDHAQRIEKNVGNKASQSEHESPQVNKLDSTTTEYSTSDIDSDEARKQSRESLNNCLQSIGATPIKTHSMAKHRRVSYVNEKLQRSFAAAVGVEENSSGRPVTSEEVKTKASDLDKLTEQMREKLTLGSTTSEEKIKILTLTPESWSIVEAVLFFGVSEYLIRQARELKKSRGILGSPDKNLGKPLPASTTEKVQLFYEDDAHSHLMPGKKDFISIKKMCTSKSDCFYATFMSCMYFSKNRIQN